LREWSAAGSRARGGSGGVSRSRAPR
jgi:hypothetical protein